jgi:tol-pal system protein YbgF
MDARVKPGHDRSRGSAVGMRPSVTIWTQEFVWYPGDPDHSTKPMACRKSPRFKPRAAAAAALAAVAMTVALPAASTAPAQEGERSFGLFDQIFGGSSRLSGGDRAAPAAARPDRPGEERTAQASGGDLVLRIDRLETQIRQLTGVIEQLQYRNQQLEGYVRRLQEDNEHRFQELGAKSPPRPAAQSHPSGAPAGPAATGATGRRGDAFDPTQNPNAPGTPHVLGATGALPPAGPHAEEPPLGAPGGRGAGAPLDLATIAPPGSPLPGQLPRNAGAPAATLPPSQTPRDEYDLAYGYVLRKDYALAEEGFRGFLSKHPGDRLAGDANYWLGESLFQRQRFRDAAEVFLNVSTKFESSGKAPDALLRLGQSLAALGEKEAACASLGEVLRKYPRASAGVKQGVEREQKRVRC